MIELQTDLQGKRAYFGDARRLAKKVGLTMCSSWEYDGAFFDATLHREGGETIYLRMPFHVLEGMLDRNDAFIEFRTPLVIKHVVNEGLDKDENSLLSATGFNQFQKPLDKDASIRDKTRWEEAGEEVSNEFARLISNIRDKYIS